MTSRGVFVTGTDTNIGKTTFCALLVSRLKKEGMRIRYFKPIQTGTDSDTETVAALSELNQDEVVPPIYRFPEPIAPNRAAILHGKEIGIDSIKAGFKKPVGDRFFVVEGAGGLLVPINSKETMRELALALGLPLIIVASTRLGTINHTLLTVEAARKASCPILGFVLNGEEDPGLAELLKDLTDLPLLARMSPMAELNAKSVVQWSEQVFMDCALERITAREGKC